jgi:hypothetical protein
MAHLPEALERGDTAADGVNGGGMYLGGGYTEGSIESSPR